MTQNLPKFDNLKQIFKKFYVPEILNEIYKKITTIK